MASGGARPRGPHWARNRALEQADAERRRIERDLHDGAQQQLIALRIKLELLNDLVGEDQAEATAMIVDIEQDVERALEQLRSLARGIYPSLLSDRGLPDALRAVVRRSPVPAELEVSGVGRLPGSVETAAYFSCVEALQNVAKHARSARSVAVRLRATRDELVFEVEDDGPGFDPEEVAAGGLLGIQDRVAAVGGELAITSTQGQGTLVQGTIPLDSTIAQKPRLMPRFTGSRKPARD